GGQLGGAPPAPPAQQGGGGVRVGDRAIEGARRGQAPGRTDVRGAPVAREQGEGHLGGAVGGGRVEACGGGDVAVAFGELRVDQLEEGVGLVEPVARDDPHQIDQGQELVGRHAAGEAPGQQVVHLGRRRVALL